MRPVSSLAMATCSRLSAASPSSGSSPQGMGALPSGIAGAFGARSAASGGRERWAWGREPSALPLSVARRMRVRKSAGAAPKRLGTPPSAPERRTDTTLSTCVSTRSRGLEQEQFEFEVRPDVVGRDEARHPPAGEALDLRDEPFSIAR